MTETQITIKDMSEYVDVDLMEKVGELLNSEHKTVSCIEFTLTAMLAISIAESASTTDEVVTQVEAYSAFLKSVAASIFVDRKIN